MTKEQVTDVRGGKEDRYVSSVLADFVSRPLLPRVREHLLLDFTLDQTSALAVTMPTAAVEFLMQSCKVP